MRYLTGENVELGDVVDLIDNNTRAPMGVCQITGLGNSCGTFAVGISSDPVVCDRKRDCWFIKHFRFIARGILPTIEYRGRTNTEDR